MKGKGKRIWELFWAFLRIGAFTFGGGYAMIGLIDDDCVQRRGWITKEELMDVTVIAESTPGPVAINCATYVGFRQAGIPGAVAATLGVVLPAFGIILAISSVLDRFLQIRAIASAFRAIKIAVGLLIFRAGLRMLKMIPKTKLSYLMMGTATLATLLIDLLAWRFSSVWLLGIAAVTAAVAFGVQQWRGRS